MAKKEKINITCYRETETWDNRNKAIKFYTECMCGSDPGSSEYSRYESIYCQLVRGATEISDEYV